MSSLVITVLTGRRPRLLSRTLRTIERQCEPLLSKSRVVALINGADEASVDIVRRTPWIDENLVHEGPLLPIGGAVSRLWQAADLGRSSYLMHLEDDWECSREWYEPALAILRSNDAIGQVRIRRHVPQSAVGHAVMRYHMVTGRPLQWEERRAGEVRYLMSRAHFTFNPALVTTTVASGLIPCESELDAARKFHATGLRVAQSLPGSFVHIGGGHSLRERVAVRQR